MMVRTESKQSSLGCSHLKQRRHYETEKESIRKKLSNDGGVEKQYSISAKEMGDIGLFCRPSPRGEGGLK